MSGFEFDQPCDRRRIGLDVGFGTVRPGAQAVQLALVVRRAPGVMRSNDSSEFDAESDPSTAATYTRPAGSTSRAELGSSSGQRLSGRG